MKNQIIKYTIILIFLISYTHPVLAEPNDPYAGDDPQTPIDGWLLWIILFGFLLGIYYLNAQKSAFNKTRQSSN